MVGQGSHRDEVNPCLGIAAKCLFGNASRGFGLIFPVYTLHGFAQRVGVKIVEHYAVHASVSHHLFQFVKVAHFYFYLQILAFFLQVGMSAVYGGFYATCKVNVVVLQHDHIVQPDAVVGTPSALHGIFLQQTHVGRGFAGIQKAGVQPFKHLNHLVGLGGNAAQPLHKVKSCPFCCQYHSRSALYSH